jgi:hypothetical protein
MAEKGDLSNFADMAAASAPDFSDAASNSIEISQVLELAQGFGINAIKAYCLYKAWETFPRGYLTEGLPIAVRPSSVPGAGEGLYARRFMPQGYTLGAYTGRLLSSGDYRRKLESYPKASEYCWVLSSGRVLDPTDDQGNLMPEVNWLAPFPPLLEKPLMSKPTTLAYVNEPPMGSDCNLMIEISGIDGSEVRFIASKNILEGEELFVDYGPNYDRSHYGRDLE